MTNAIAPGKYGDHQDSLVSIIQSAKSTKHKPLNSKATFMIYLWNN